MVLLICQPAVAGHLYREKEYQDAWCAKAGGVTEYTLDDGTRVDCLTDDYAIEFDFASKWAESVGQALYYSMQTGRQPGIVLILEKESDRRYLKRLKTLQTKFGFKIWTMPLMHIRG
ncbi:MAG: hypothetical protein KGZ62_09940 [Sulfurimonas sp.]|nr:hypothetical protein [Sulfurimonas sp.]